MTIPLFKVAMSPAAKDLVSNVLDSGMVGEGPRVAELANRLKSELCVQNIVLTNSCTSALIIALRLAGVNSTSTVISTPFTMLATNCAIKTAGAKIYFTDVDPATWCLDTKSILEETNKRKIDAVVITLVAGIPPADLDILYRELRKQGIKLIIDAAHSYKSTFRSANISEFADYTCYSFQSIKHLTTIDGGAIVCKSKEDHDRAERLKWFGMSRIVPEGMTRLEHQMKSPIEEWGYKAHLTDVYAAIGLANLDIADSAVLASRRNARCYIESLSDIENIVLPKVYEHSNPAFWVFGFRYLGDRDGLVQHLISNGVDASPMWRRNDEVIESINNIKPYVPHDIIFIPNGFWVTEEDRENIVRLISNFDRTAND